MCCASGVWFQGTACGHRSATNFAALAEAGTHNPDCCLLKRGGGHSAAPFPHAFGYRPRRSPGRRTEPQTKSPAIRPGFSIQIRERGLRRLVRGSDGLVAVGLEIFLAFALTFGTRFGFGAAARAFGELAFDFLDRFGLGRVLHHRDLAGETIERRFDSER